MRKPLAWLALFAAAIALSAFCLPSLAQNDDPPGGPAMDNPPPPAEGDPPADGDLPPEPVPDGATPEAPKETDPAKAARRSAELFSVFTFGYGPDANIVPRDLRRFEDLVRTLSNAGYTALMCQYSDDRARVCLKYNFKMMVDLLAPGEHVFKEPDKAKALCQRLRKNRAVLAYHLWSDTFGNTAAGRQRDINNVHEWDPTHPTYIGTYKTGGLSALGESDYLSYYDFHWARGIDNHFGHLQAALRVARGHQTRFGQFFAAKGGGAAGGENLLRQKYSVNTSLACGLKGCLWFIGGEVMDKSSFAWNVYGRDLMEVHRQILYPLKLEMPKLGNPAAVYSTKITRDVKNKPLPAAAMPPGLGGNEFPAGFWLQPVSGEFVCGVFTSPAIPAGPSGSAGSAAAPGQRAIFIANHNPQLEQAVKLKLSGPLKPQHFNRRTRKWEPAPAVNGVLSFRLEPAGGELFRFDETPTTNPASQPVAGRR